MAVRHANDRAPARFEYAEQFVDRLLGLVEVFDRAHGVNDVEGSIPERQRPHVASGDRGASAARKFDIEAWVPSQERYREVTSTSNCTEFQARRLRIRMRDADGVRPLATLNGTLVAITRTIVALLENHQQADGSVRVPAALRPYLGGRETLDPLS